MTTSVSRPRGRPRAPEITADLLELLAFFGSDIAACAAGFGLSRGTMNSRLREDPELRQSYERGRAGFQARTAVNAASIIAMVQASTST
jgi:hypothetical protein